MSKNKHSAYDLAQMQSLPLQAKIRMTKERIKQWYEYFGGQVYVSFSGGKDSTVLKHIVDSMYNDVPALFVNTGLEYPEIQKFVKDIKEGKYDCFNTDVEIVRPERRFDEVIKEYGYPIASKELSMKIYYAKKGSEWAKKYVDGSATEPMSDKPSRYRVSKTWLPFMDENAPKISPFCCNIMKKKPAHRYSLLTNRKVILGTMASESKIREQAWEKTGCNAFESNIPKSQPMSFWTKNDVLEYIRTLNVPYASVYGDIVKTGKTIERLTGNVPELKTTGCDRTGCMFCMFGCHIKNDKRFVEMKNTHPKQYDYCMKSVEEGGLGLKDVIDWTNAHCNTKILY